MNEVLEWSSLLKNEAMYFAKIISRMTLLYPLQKPPRKDDV